MAGLAGIWAPETGIVDYGQVAAAYAHQVQMAGGRVRTNRRIQRVQRLPDRIVLETAPAGASLSRIPAEIVLEPQKVLTLPVTVTAPAGTRGRAPLKFTVESGDGRVRKSVDSSFFGPI